MATVLLKLPLLRHIYAWMGCVPADYHAMRDTLKHASVGVVPEVIFLHPASDINNPLLGLQGQA